MIRAAGAVVWRHGQGDREVAVVHRPRYDDWSLPKGKLAPDETHLLAAMREVREETGLTGAVGPSLGTTEYEVDGQPKAVRWWSLQADAGEFVANDEVDALRWLPLDQASALVRERQPLRRWAALPAQAAVVLLVRHGSAGDPDRWSGDDDARPLDARGLEQAAQIARVLTAYRPTRVLCAPPLRCRDTIAPLAQAMGLPVEIDPLVGENGAPARPDGHVLDLARPGSTVVVCSQGGVIPRVVNALVPARAPARARKGGVWALSVVGGEAVGADDDILT